LVSSLGFLGLLFLGAALSQKKQSHTLRSPALSLNALVVGFKGRVV